MAEWYLDTRRSLALKKPLGFEGGVLGLLGPGDATNEVHTGGQGMTRTMADVDSQEREHHYPNPPRWYHLPVSRRGRTGVALASVQITATSGEGEARDRKLLSPSSRAATMRFLTGR